MLPAKLPSGVRPILKSIYQQSQRRKIAFYAVGGCVRDWILGLETKDLDLVCEQDPMPIARFAAGRWKGQLEAFERFGTARLFVHGGFRIDFARAREETYAKPAALPEVRPGTILHDLVRRDFTINAMAAELTPDGFGEPLDPHGGREDLQRKILRVLHPASFRDDPTRMYRAARFACRFRFELEPSTEAQRHRAAREGWIELLSRERLRGELVRVLEERKPIGALKKIQAWGLAEPLHPKLSWPRGLERVQGVWERLGAIALHMGSPEGDELISSLHLERTVGQALLAALKLAREKAAPRSPLPPLTEAVLRRSLQRLSDSALDPLYVGGDDLRALGLAPGPGFKLWLDRAAQAQWRGEFSSRSEALRWLKRRLAGQRTR